MKKSSNVDLMKSNKIIEYIKSCSEKSSDISYRKVKFNDEYIYIVYADSMSSTDLISNFIIKSIVDISKNKEEISLYEKQNFEEKNAKEKISPIYCRFIVFRIFYYYYYRYSSFIVAYF